MQAESYFIDRNPDLFVFVFDFLRFNRFSSHFELIDLVGLLSEFKFYGIDIFDTDPISVRIQLKLYNYI